MIRAIVDRPATGNFPGADINEIIGEILKVAPKGQDKVWSGLSGADANELAFKAAFFWYQAKERLQHSILSRRIGFCYEE